MCSWEVTRVNNSVTKNPAYNANGQQTDDAVNYTYEWDAFGRLRKVKNRSNSALVVEYTYNGLNHQIGRHADLDADGDVDSTDKWEWTIYDPRWRRVATYMVAGGSTFTGAVDSNPRERYVHHASGPSGMGSYIDSVVLRDRDQTGSNNSSADATMEQRLYYGQNWRADVSVTMTDTGRILERIKYSAYGVATRVPVADFNRDGVVDFFDDIAYDDCYTGAGCPSGQTADMNLDGFVDSFDYDEWDLNFSEQGSTARGVLSQSSGSAAVNRLGYAGYWFEPSTQQHLVRNREFDPVVGVWDERDPMGFHDGADLYMYVMDNPLNGWDSMGLFRQDEVPCDNLEWPRDRIACCGREGDLFMQSIPNIHLVTDRLCRNRIIMAYFDCCYGGGTRGECESTARQQARECIRMQAPPVTITPLPQTPWGAFVDCALLNTQCAILAGICMGLIAGGAALCGPVCTGTIGLACMACIASAGGTAIPVCQSAIGCLQASYARGCS